MTPASNAVPVALIDVLIVGVAAAWLILAVNDVRRWQRGAPRARRGMRRAHGRLGGQRRTSSSSRPGD